MHQDDIRVVPHDPDPGETDGNTPWFEVIKDDSSPGGEMILGTIHYRPSWRRYTFYPNNQRLFDADCLRFLADELDAILAKERPQHTVAEGGQRA